MNQSASPNNKLRVGMVGAGGIARAAHLPGWQRLGNVEIVAVADVAQSAAESLAKECGARHVFTDYRRLLELELDAIDVCTPNRTHAPIVVAALESGKHVICEKPLATTAAEVRLMGETADRAGKLLMTAQHQRFTDSARAIKAWIDDGNLGPVYHARVRAMRRALLPPRPGFIDRALSGGGPCMDIGVHALDLCLWLMGFPDPVRVSGTSKVNFALGERIPGRWGEWDRSIFSVEDFAAGIVHFDNGATLMLEAAWLGHQKEEEDMSCQLFGQESGVYWPSGEFATVRGQAFVQGSLTAAQRDDKPHAAEIAAFAKAIANNAPSPVPWRESLRVISILEAVYRSQEAGREIVLSGAAEQSAAVTA